MNRQHDNSVDSRRRAWKAASIVQWCILALLVLNIIVDGETFFLIPAAVVLVTASISHWRWDRAAKRRKEST
ncbi:MAG: hypothetical protein F4045_04380 [Chloroflexi bacterium]|nr:hypothetical protein [Chloroflexota bacterium]MYK34348.1 hypothetical protein [Chloroflexota bacterium]